MNNPYGITNSSIMKRRLKSLTERILFIDSSLIYDEINIVGITCQILGSRNISYDLKIYMDELSGVQCSCSCLDFTMRNNYCKHIYWFGLKKFRNMDPKYWSAEIYSNFILQNWIIENNTELKGKNEDCPICLEEIDYDNEKTIRCRLQCNNSVHSICWNRYYNISGKTQCVFCRGEILSTYV